MINNSGEVLVHADYQLVQNAVNVSEYKFVRDILESPDRSKQSLINTDFGVTRKSGKNNGFFKNAKIFLLKYIGKEKPEITRQFMAYTKLDI